MKPEKGQKKFQQEPKYPHLRSDGMTKRSNGGTKKTDKPDDRR